MQIYMKKNMEKKEKSRILQELEQLLSEAVENDMYGMHDGMCGNQTWCKIKTLVDSVVASNNDTEVENVETKSDQTQEDA